MNSGIYSLVAINPDGTRNNIKDYNKVKLTEIDWYTARFTDMDNMKERLYSDGDINDLNAKITIIYNRNGEHEEPILFKDKIYITESFSGFFESRIPDDLYEDALRKIDKGEFIIPSLIEQKILPPSFIESLEGCFREDKDSILNFLTSMKNYKYFRDFIYCVEKAIEDYKKDYINDRNGDINYNYHPKFNPSDQDNPETAPYEFITDEDYKNEHIR